LAIVQKLGAMRMLSTTEGFGENEWSVSQGPQRL